ncbi:MAG: alpha-1,2-fucosyltransferase [bacterium]|nr:alpha-1,2-fucosyltransferase [bacterium]
MLDRLRQSSQPIAVHVRRGDYLKLAGSPVLPMSYYERAVDLIRQWVPDSEFFVFSDDPEWARTNLHLDVRRVEFVDINSEAAPHEDLRLMSSCKGHIIANSTLSWWGAWLSERPEKCVIAPKYWFSGVAESARIPDQWVTLDNRDLRDGRGI